MLSIENAFLDQVFRIVSMGRRSARGTGQTLAPSLFGLQLWDSQPQVPWTSISSNLQAAVPRTDLLAEFLTMHWTTDKALQ